MNGDTHSSKTVVNGGDDQRVAHPDESRRSQGYPTQRASNWRNARGDRVAASSTPTSTTAAYAMHRIEGRTEVLGHAQLVRWAREVLQARRDQTPLHDRRPEEDRLRACMRSGASRAARGSWRVGSHEKHGNCGCGEASSVRRRSSWRVPSHRTCWVVHERLELRGSC